MEKATKTSLPRLFGRSKNGKIKIIDYFAEEIGDGSVNICNVHGYIDGKKQTDIRNIKTGKNVGRSNETTVFQQAVLEMESKWRAKLDSNYTQNESGIPDMNEISLLPMLALSFDKRKHNIVYPCFVQPKLNGVRCMARIVDGNVSFTSRKYKPYNDTLSHLSEEAEDILSSEEGLVLDGEIYKHGLGFQDIVRRVKKNRGKDTEELEYWIYDIADTEHDNLYRDAKIKRLLESGYSKIVRLEAYTAYSEEDVRRFHDEFVKNGFEGVIIRNISGKYTFDKRSADLQKLKAFIDSEFVIVGATSGEGREEDAIIIKCETNNKTFNVRPKGTIKSRIEMMESYKKCPQNFIGKQYTVRYFELTEDGIPQFPVGIAIRDYE